MKIHPPALFIQLIPCCDLYKMFNFFKLEMEDIFATETL
jgi:hypothetical protein